jgi:hypothetical protein
MYLGAFATISTNLDRKKMGREGKILKKRV